jgi:hypothetical protein
MKNELKHIIQSDYDSLMPVGMQLSMKSNVMRRVEQLNPHKQLNHSEDLKLFALTTLCLGLIYVFGYNPDYKISISIPGNWLKNIIMTVFGILTLLFLMVNEYFDRKKFIYV